MLEGLLILGIGAAIIVVALFGTTIYATLAAAAASISAMFVGATTGAANLLTSWFSWVLAADATTFYLGYIWFAGWIALFSYSAFKIATSDKKKWMNLVGRGSNYLGIMLILFLVAQPIVVSYGSAFMADTTGYTAIDYNVSTQFLDLYSTEVNATSAYYGAQTELFDNDTATSVVASLVMPDIDGTIIEQHIAYKLNITFTTKTITKITINYNYIGTGNITNFKISSTVSPYPVFKQYETTSFGSNQTITWIPEIFQSNQIKSLNSMLFKMYFEATGADTPTDGDYFDITVTFYETATILSQETIMLWLGASMAALDIMGLLYASGFLRKYIL